MHIGLVGNQASSLRLILLASVFFTMGCEQDPRAAENSCTADSWQAFEAAKSGDYKRAASLYKSALAAAEHSDNLLQKPQVLKELAALDLLRKDAADAEAHLRSSLSAYAKIETNNHMPPSQLSDLRIAKLAAVEKLADLLAEQKSFAEAEQYYKEAFQLDETSGHGLEDHLRIESSYAKVLRAENKNEDAEAFEIDADASRMTKKDIEAGVMSSISNIDKGTLLSIPKMKGLLTAAQRYKRHDLTRAALDLLGLAELGHFNLAKADANFEKSLLLDHPDETGGMFPTYKENMASALAARAWCLVLQGKNDWGKNLLERAIHQDPNAALRASHHVMDIMYILGKKREAEQIGDVILQFPEKCDLKDGKTVEVLGRELMLCGSVGKFDGARARLFRERGLAVVEQHGGEAKHPALMSEFLGNVADNCLESGDYPRAIRLYERSISLFAKRKNANDLEKHRLEENLAKAKAKLTSLLSSPTVSYNASVPSG